MAAHAAMQMVLKDIAAPDPEAIPIMIRRMITPRTGHELVKDVINLAKQARMFPSTSKVQTTVAFNSMQFQTLQMGMIMHWENMFIALVVSRPKFELCALVPLYTLFNLGEMQHPPTTWKISNKKLRIMRHATLNHASLSSSTSRLRPMSLAPTVLAAASLVSSRGCDENNTRLQPPKPGVSGMVAHATFHVGVQYVTGEDWILLPVCYLPGSRHSRITQIYLKQEGNPSPNLETLDVYHRVSIIAHNNNG